jgi:alpha-tubulin suppressor-like RCC1 family protein
MKPHQFVVTATKTDNTLWVWGSGSNGSLGLNDVINRSSPTQVTFSNWSKINVGQFLISIVKTDGTLWMFGGNNIQGVYGNDTAVNVSSPIQIGSSTNWREVWPGQTVCFGVKTDGTAWVWGSSAYGNTGLNDLVSRSSPTQLGSLTTWKSGRIFGGHALAITTSNQLFTWGRNINGMLGDNITYGANRSSPAQVGSATNWQFAQIGGTTTAFALRS